MATTAAALAMPSGTFAASKLSRWGKGYASSGVRSLAAVRQNGLVLFPYLPAGGWVNIFVLVQGLNWMGWGISPYVPITLLHPGHVLP